MAGQKISIEQQLAVSTWTRKAAPAKRQNAAPKGGKKASTAVPAKKPAKSTKG